MNEKNSPKQTPPLTLEQFRAERAYNPDLRNAVGDLKDVYEDCYEECPGYVYPGLLVIDGASHHTVFSCIIGNVERTGSLAQLEEWLYEYGVSERLFDDYEVQS